MQNTTCATGDGRKPEHASVQPLSRLASGLLALFLVWFWVGMSGQKSEAQERLPGGELRIVDATGQKIGLCPLRHTEVSADIVGFVSRVRLRQTFYNPLEAKIEAVYVFPLPSHAAVDDMVMRVGDRRIVGQIKPRDEARAIYEAARSSGNVAGLLDQERPNIFTQSVANIEPGAEVVIEIRYVETLKFEDGVFEFVFPMVVGPRYMPGVPTGKSGPGWSPDTTEVPDASRLSPPVAPPGTRAGHDISLTVHIDAGMRLFEVESPLHAVEVERPSPEEAVVRLANRTEIPNRDFILRYRTAGEDIGDAFLLHRDTRGTFFTLMLQPPQRVQPAQAVPKEMIFVIDRSGSMRGFPIEKAKQTMRLAIQQLNPDDTFNLLSFSGGTGRCFATPVRNTPRHRATALQYLADLYGAGGTEMMPAILEALGGQHDPERVRIVAFMTDGYIGNDFAIIEAVRKYAGTSRVFAFGIGNAVNRFLLDAMAHAGRGEAEYVTLQTQAEGAAQRFQERIQAPVLTDIAIDWGNLPVTEVYPKRIPDLFSHTPIMIHGRLSGPAEGSIRLRGRTVNGPFERRLSIRSASDADDHDAMASLWARAKVRDLLMQDYAAVQRGRVPEAMRREITALGVAFRLVTRFTSFVAVEEMAVTTIAGEPVTVAVPVDIPAGVSYAGIFGQKSASTRRRASLSLPRFSTGVAPQGKSMRLMTMPHAESVDLADRDDAAAAASNKLAEPLRRLAEKFSREGTDGRLTMGQLRVVDYQVDVMVLLRDMSDLTLHALETLGFIRTGESHTIRLLIGRIDVRRLQKLARLDAVLRVTPVMASSAVRYKD